MLSPKVRQKLAAKMRSTWLLSVLLVPVVALVVGAATPQAEAQPVSFAEQEIFFEFNFTDLDLGLHIFFDAEAWQEVEVRGPDGEIFEVENDGKLSDLGSTEVFTESAEPPLCAEDEEDVCDIAAAIAAFQAQFPEGWYRFRGRTIDRKRLRGRAFLSHDLPNAPEIEAPEDLPTDSNTPYVIEWTQSAGGPDIMGYEAVAELVIEVNGDERTLVNTATLLDDARQLTISPEFVELIIAAHGNGTLVEFKVEIIARAENLNKTSAEEVIFELEEPE